ncbi:MAG: AraC family transcriptional regulator [Eubacteriales bacterium]|nr:AraC family transcriptional regulator [Eubacteriales bacterium]
MNYGMIIDKLNHYENDELFYKEYYNTKKAELPVEEILKRHRDEQELLGYVLHPEDLEVNHLEEGDLCIMAPHVTHGIEVFDDSVILNILIRHSTFMDIFINTIRDKTQISMFFLNNIYSKKKLPYLLFHTDGDLTIRNYILDMYIEQSNLDEFSDRIICSIMTIFFTQLIRLHKKNLEIPESYKQKNACENDIFNYIVNNYAETSLEQVAKHFHFSVPYCSKLIKDIAGCTFSEFQENIRLQQSENYLLYTQLSVADISEKIGFKNPETFIRMFKRHRKMTPSKYRKVNTGNV